MLRRAALWMLMATAIAADVSAQTSSPYAERLRPQFHFTSSTDWINDPNGLVYYEGEWHLFFQRVPGSNDGNTMTKSWGHAVSTDLVRWTQLPDALSPDAAGSIWSGSAVVDWHNSSGYGVDGKPPLVAFYTNAKDPFDQRLAYSNDRGRTWTKVAEPILKNVQGRNRDPKVIWYEPTQRWIMALYLDQRHRFALYSSSNLKDWTLLHELTLEGDDECPDFFPLALDGDASKEKWIYTGANGRYLVGTFDGKVFTPETDSLASDKGTGTYYAAQTYSDSPDGRRVQIAWLRDGRYPGMPFNQQLGFPLELTLRSTARGPRLFKWPVREIESLYTGKRLGPQPAAIALPDGQDVLDGVAVECADITLALIPGTARSITLNVRGTPITLLTETPTTGAITSWDRRVPVALDGGRLELRVLVDRTSLELFANEGEVVMTGLFAPPAENHSLKLTAAGEGARVESLAIREVKSAWPTTAPAAEAKAP